MPRHLLATYPQQSGRYDEMFAQPLTPRPHWQRLFRELSGTPPEAMREKLQYVEQQVRENGVTYNMYADAQGEERPWDLHMIPLILGPEEWAGIEAAIAQRATLLNRILADIYGPHELLAEGALPPALVHGHAGFLRPCHGIKPPGDIHLHVYAADLARSPDGQWWVVGDRTQAPSGMGYALENRLIVSRVFPELFRDLNVQHVASFFQALRDSVAHFAPHGDEPPLTVLLTPGPYNETYFEHAYLSRYLGFPLVEGHDLTVRNGCVWLKTLSGLQRVHAILRRQDDDYCDPLELRADSALGIAGLTECARRGTVLIANALGSNLLESGTLLGYLPGLCERLLGEPLRMPSVGTWWCGEPAALEDVIEKLDHLVIKPAFPQIRGESVFGEDLKDEARTRLIDKLRARPSDFVAQELVRLSQAPVWDRHHTRRLQARAMGLRVFACATPQGYTVMPGGLTRVASSRDARMISTQRGGGSKDTWVVTTGEVSSFSLLRTRIGAGDLVRSGTNISSRVVENLFWFGRYAERCDNTARLLRIMLDRLIDAPGAGTNDSGEWPAMLALAQHMELVSEEPEGADGPALRRDLLAVTFDGAAGGLAANLRQLHRVAFSLRERLSQDNWRTLNRLTQNMERHQARLPIMSEALATLDDVVVSMMTLSGFALDGMTRDQGWRFMSVGRRVERLSFLATTLNCVTEAAPDGRLDWLLELADSVVTYRSRYVSRPEWLPVLDLLVLDESNPRSVSFQILGLHDYLTRLSAVYPVLGGDATQPLIERLQALDVATDLDPASPVLRELLHTAHATASAVSDQLAQRMFTHVEAVVRT
jgi:uncharacterized circularly permuted ATP-grasp superfamily protein/uncharacterized alpha-E superfamily protein